jgi:regulatory protein
LAPNTVTALRARPRGRVAVELDGTPWRTLPAEAVLASGITVGVELDRPTARRLRRELRRLEALDVALRTLKARDVSSERLRRRLESRSVAAADREATLATLARAGLVDDARYATARARALAERAYGDAAIAAELERQGISGEFRAEALDALEPEAERAREVVRRRGRGPRTAAYLARRGFGEDALAAAVDADFANEA